MNCGARQEPHEDEAGGRSEVTIAVSGLLCRFKLIGAGFWPSKRVLDIRLSGAHIIGSRVGSSQSSGCSVARGRGWFCARPGSFDFGLIF